MDRIENGHEEAEALKIGDIIFMPARPGDREHRGKYAVPGQVRSEYGLTYKQQYAELAWIKDRAKKMGKPLQRVKLPRWR